MRTTTHVHAYSFGLIAQTTTAPRSRTVCRGELPGHRAAKCSSQSLPAFSSARGQVTWSRCRRRPLLRRGSFPARIRQALATGWPCAESSRRWPLRPGRRKPLVPRQLEVLPAVLRGLQHEEHLAVALISPPVMMVGRSIVRAQGAPAVKVLCARRGRRAFRCVLHHHRYHLLRLLPEAHRSVAAVAFLLVMISPGRPALIQNRMMWRRPSDALLRWLHLHRTD